jgi:hypothetical protein
MRQKQLKNGVLLVYLALLTSLGPSFHRAHFFGLHSHSNGQCQSATGSSCCGHAHSYDSHQPDIPSHDHSHPNKCVRSVKFSNASLLAPAMAPTTVPSLTVPDSVTNCPFCKFFENYHVTLVAFEPSVVAAPLFLFHTSCVLPTSASAISAIARGPPGFLAA